MTKFGRIFYTSTLAVHAKVNAIRQKKLCKLLFCSSKYISKPLNGIIYANCFDSSLHDTGISGALNCVTCIRHISTMNQTKKNIQVSITSDTFKKIQSIKVQASGAKKTVSIEKYSLYKFNTLQSALIYMKIYLKFITVLYLAENDLGLKGQRIYKEKNKSFPHGTGEVDDL